MPVELDIKGVFYTATEAAEKLGYRDCSYITQLCTQKKIEATKIGRTWLIPESWVLEQERISPKGQGNRGVARK